MNTTEAEPYNGEESELRDVAEDTNSTVISVSDVIKNVLKNTQMVTDQNEEGTQEQVKIRIFEREMQRISMGHIWKFCI